MKKQYKTERDAKVGTEKCRFREAYSEEFGIFHCRNNDSKFPCEMITYYAHKQYCGLKSEDRED